MRSFKSCLAKHAALYVAANILADPELADAPVSTSLTILKPLLVQWISGALRDLEKEQHFRRGWAGVVADSSEAANFLASAQAKHALGKLFIPVQNGVIPEYEPLAEGAAPGAPAAEAEVEQPEEDEEACHPPNLWEDDAPAEEDEDGSPAEGDKDGDPGEGQTCGEPAEENVGAPALAPPDPAVAVMSRLQALRWVYGRVPPKA